METKNQKFQRLARKRSAKVADELRKIGNLGSANYEYTEEEVGTLFSYIENRVQESRAAFNRFSRKSVPPLEF